MVAGRPTELNFRSAAPQATRGAVGPSMPPIPHRRSARPLASFAPAARVPRFGLEPPPFRSRGSGAATVRPGAVMCGGCAAARAGAPAGVWLIDGCAATGWPTATRAGAPHESAAAPVSSKSGRYLCGPGDSDAGLTVRPPLFVCQ